MLFLAPKSFPDGVSAWRDFYMLAGTAAATLMGLLFVAISLNRDVFTHETRTDLRLLAAQTFSRFLLILEVALMFLIPDQTRAGLALPLLGFTSIGAVLHWRTIPKTLRLNLSAASRAQIIFPLVSYAAMGAVSVALLSVSTKAALNLLYWLVGVFLLLIAGAARNAWDFLMVVVLDRESEEAGHRLGR